jgi:hypothetical protein
MTNFTDGGISFRGQCDRLIFLGRQIQALSDSAVQCKARANQWTSISLSTEQRSELSLRVDDLERLTARIASACEIIQQDFDPNLVAARVRWLLSQIEQSQAPETYSVSEPTDVQSSAPQKASNSASQTTAKVSDFGNGFLAARGFEMVAIDGLSNNEIQGVADFKKVSFEEMQLGLQRFQETMLPVLERGDGLTVEYWQHHDEVNGLDPRHGLAKVFTVLFERIGDPIRIDFGGEVPVVVNGRHRIFVAQSLGITHLPASVAGRVANQNQSSGGYAKGIQTGISPGLKEQIDRLDSDTSENPNVGSLKSFPTQNTGINNLGKPLKNSWAEFLEKRLVEVVEKGMAYVSLFGVAGALVTQFMTPILPEVKDDSPFCFVEKKPATFFVIPTDSEPYEKATAVIDAAEQVGEMYKLRNEIEEGLRDFEGKPAMGAGPDPNPK